MFQKDLALQKIGNNIHSKSGGADEADDNDDADDVDDADVVV